MKPLTIDELKALKVGDWVWIVGEKERFYNQKVGTSMNRFMGNYRTCPYSGYNKTWIAYKNKEEAEAKGEIVELPCRHGDKVYALYQNCLNKKNYIKESTAFAFIVYKNYIDIDTGTLHGDCQEVYATRKEAERRLAELKGETK